MPRLIVYRRRFIHWSKQQYHSCRILTNEMMSHARERDGILVITLGLLMIIAIIIGFGIIQLFNIKATCRTYTNRIEHSFRCWFIDLNIEHRSNGPAVEYTDGSKKWFIVGKLHRSDGPAVEHANGKFEWWWYGTELSFEEYLKLANWSDEKIIMWKLEHGRC